MKLKLPTVMVPAILAVFIGIVSIIERIINRPFFTVIAIFVTVGLVFLVIVFDWRNK